MNFDRDLHKSEGVPKNLEEVEASSLDLNSDPDPFEKSLHISDAQTEPESKEISESSQKDDFIESSVILIEEVEDGLESIPIRIALEHVIPEKLRYEEEKISQESFDENIPLAMQESSTQTNIIERTLHQITSDLTSQLEAKSNKLEAFSEAKLQELHEGPEKVEEIKADPSRDLRLKTIKLAEVAAKSKEPTKSNISSHQEIQGFNTQDRAIQKDIKSSQNPHPSKLSADLTSVPPKAASNLAQPIPNPLFSKPESSAYYKSKLSFSKTSSTQQAPTALNLPNTPLTSLEESKHSRSQGRLANPNLTIDQIISLNIPPYSLDKPTLRSIESSGYMYDSSQRSWKKCLWIYAIYNLEESACEQYKLQLMRHIKSSKIKYQNFESFSLDQSSDSRTHKKRVWRFPYIRENKDISRFQLRVSNESGDKDFYERYGTFRSYLHDETHQFLWNIEIISKTGWFKFRSDPPGANINKDLQQLSYYLEYLLENSDITATLPTLLKQFNERVRYSYDSVEHFLNFLDKYIKKSTSRNLEEVCLGIISVLGSSKNFKFTKKLLFESNETIFRILIPNLEPLLNTWKEEFMRDYTISGLVKLIILDINFDGKSWMNILENLRSGRYILKVCKELLEGMQGMKFNMSSDEYLQILNKVISIEGQDLISLLPLITPNLLSLSRFLQFLFEVYTKSVTIPIKDSQSFKRLSRDEKRGFSSIINKFFNQTTLSLKTLLEVLRYLKDCDIQFKEVFYESSLAYKIGSLILKEYIYTSNYTILKTIYAEYYDENLFHQLPYDKFIKNLILQCNNKLCEVLNCFTVSTELAVSLFNVWIGKIIEERRSPEMLVESMDSQLKHIHNIDLTLPLCKAAIKYLRNYCDIKRRDFLSIASRFDSVSLPDLRSCYIDYITTHYLNDSSPIIKQQVIKSIESFMKKDENSSVLLTILSIALELGNTLTEDSVKKDLLNDPCGNRHWLIIINNYAKYAEKKFSKILVNGICDVGRSIVQKTVRIYDINVINRHSKLQIDMFVKIVESVNDVIQEELEKSFETYLEEALILLRDILYSIDNIEVFFNIIGVSMLDYPEIRSIYSQNTLNLDHLPLISFQFSPQLSPILQISSYICPLKHSTIFRNYLNHLKPSSISSTTVGSLCISAYDTMISDISNLLKHFDSTLLGSIWFNFTIEKSIDEEMNLLSSYFKPNYVLQEKLRDLLHYLKLRNYLKDICNAVISLRNSVGFRDDRMTALCNHYLNQVSDDNIHKISSYDFVSNSSSIYKTIKSIIRDEEEFQEIGSLLRELSISQELIEYLNRLNEDQIHDLIEGVNDYDDSFVNTQTILNLSNIWKFNIEIAQGVRDYESLVVSIRNKLKIPEFKQLVQQLKTCNSQLNSIKDLHNELFCKEEAKKRQIFEIFRESHFIIDSGHKEKGLDIQLRYASKPNHVINILSLLELKDRASLYKNPSNTRLNEESPEDLNKISIFIELVNSVNNIIRSLNNLYDNGYPEFSRLDREFSIQAGLFREVKEFESILHDQLKEWEDMLREAYDNYYFLTCLSGRQFWILEKYLFSTSETPHKAINLLNFLSKDTSQEHLTLQPISNSVSERLKNLGRALDNMQSKPIQDYKFNIPIRKVVSDYREILYLESNKPLSAMISLFLNSEFPFPKAYQILYCRSDSKWRELNAFLYRCFRSPTGELFVLMDCENLSLENQNRFQSLFNYLYYESSIYSNFRLALITADSRSTLSQYFKYSSNLRVLKLQSSYILPDDSILNIIQTVDNRSEVVISRISGLGKSEYIHRKAIQNKLNSVMFTISGEINMHNICQKLQAIQFSSYNQLHIAINYLDDPVAINDFLLKLSLFGIYGDYLDIISIPANTYISIEIANTYQEELYHSLPYLKYLKTHYISEFDINSLIVPSDPISPIQLVCSYLYYYDNHQINSIEINVNTLTNTLVQSKDTIIYLLDKYFITKQQQKGQEISYTQLFVFIHVLDKLLRNFENSPYFQIHMIQQMIADLNVQNLQALAPDYNSLRERLIEGLLFTTEEFTTKSLTNVKTMQNEAQRHKSSQDYDDDEYMHNFKCNFAWESSNHFNVIFLKEGEFISIYRHKEMVPENIRKLLLIQSSFRSDGTTLLNMISKQSYNIEDYSTMTHYDLLLKLKNFNNSEEFEFIHMDSEYVLTPDNYLKMNLIYLKALANLPIILMGETGCGKTKLVEFFVCEVLGERFEKISIHAGVTSEMIYDKIREIVGKARENLDGRYWVFFDEFNTSYCIGSLSYTMCDRIFEGEKLPNNIVLVGACNPYRIKGKKVCFDENVGIRNKYRDSHSEFKLIHVVKPLPDSMLDYVCDFGQLQESDFERYAEKMLEQGTKRKIVGIFVKIICECHKYFKAKEDVSSVSLRDVRRFIVLYNWFKASLKIKAKLKDSTQYRVNVYKYNLTRTARGVRNSIKAGILALCHCYYLRISSQDQRYEFISTILQSSSITEDSLFQVLDDEMNDYLARMELPKGTALNTALKENVFAAIPCILNQIPIIICGKPGCSKSLAIQLIFTNLRGSKSNDPYFRTLKELTMVSFQGSDSCTSEGILKAFERAKKYLETNSKVLLPVVVFDEIGLAEISKHNPLKVLHSLLEMDNRSVGFVGISNWRLDASKMNRAVYLARPDPDKSDLVYTAFSIYDSYNRGYNRHENLIQNLAYAYYEFKQRLKNTEFADFYGLRDFYHLIKSVTRNLIQLDVTDRTQQATIVKFAIERNFGGMAGAVASIGEIFSQIQHLEEIYPYIPDTNVLNLINQNLEDKSARYLMLICKGDVGTFILDKFLRISKENRRILIGSSLYEDLNNVEYGFSALSDVILYGEKGISVIFKDMNSIYSSLYDLFNQNFAVSGDRKYCRIAMGALFNPRCFIHDDFHAIIVMNAEENISKVDAPFLNRFEKQYIDLFDLISQDSHKLLIQELKTWVHLLFEISVSGAEKQFLDIKNMLPIYNEETIALLVLYNYTQDLPHDSILLKCKRSLLQVTTADVLVISDLSKLDHEEIHYVRETWKELHGISFPELLEEYLTNKMGHYQGNKIVVFTYGKEILGSKYYTNFDDSILHVTFSTLKSEQDIRKELINFYEQETKELYLMEMDLLIEGTHLSMLEFMIDKLELETKHRWRCVKSVCVIVHMKRNVRYERNINMLDGWDYWMLDDLNVNPYSLSDEILHYSTYDLIISEQLANIEEIIEQLIEKCMLKFKYERSLYYKNPDMFNYYIFEMVDLVRKHPAIKSTFKAKILKVIQERKTQLKSWKKQIFCDPDVIDSSIDVFSAIYSVLTKEIETAFTLVLYLIEKNQAFKSFFTYDGETHGEVIKRIWRYKLNSLGSAGIMLQAINHSIITKFGIHLKFPFIKIDYGLVSELFKKLKENGREESRIESEEMFKQEFYNRSVIGGEIENLENSQILVEIYMRDVIKLYLSDHLFELRYEDLAFELLKSISDGKKGLACKLIMFFSYKELLYYIVTLVTSIQEFQDIDITSKIKSLICEYQHLNQNTSYKELFSYILSTLIKLQTPRAETLSKVGWSIRYIELVNKILNALKIIRYEHNIRIQELDTIEFWLSYISLIHKLKLPEVYLEDTVIFADSNKNEEKSYIFTKVFFESIRNKLDSILEDDSGHEDCIMKFYCEYYVLLMQYIPGVILDFATRLEKTNLWRYSGKFIARIVSKSNMLALIELIESNGLEYAYQHEEYLENQYIKSIEEALVLHGVTSRFAILLSDHILLNLHKIRKTHTANRLNQLLYILTTLNKFATDPSSVPITHNLISATSIRYSLDLLSQFISQASDLTHNEIGIMQDILLSINNTQMVGTYKLYCLKKIKQIHNLANSELYSFLAKKDVINLADIPNCSPNEGILNIFPYNQSISASYSHIAMKLAFLREGGMSIDALDEFILRKSPEDKLAFGLAILNEIFASYIYNPDIQDSVRNWYESRKYLIESNLGLIYRTLIDNLVLNYPYNSFLKLSTDKQQELPCILIICFINMIVVSYNDRVSPITSLFFEADGNSERLVERMNSMYVMGVECDISQNEYYSTLDFYTGVRDKRYPQPGTLPYICSCGYIYYVENCGKPMEVAYCPQCKQKIGGLEHSLVERKGHEVLDLQRAIDIIQDKIRTSEESAKRGYTKLNSRIELLRGLKSISIRMMHIILNSILYNFRSCNILSTNQLKDILPNNCEEDLINSIKDGLHSIYSKLDCDDGYIWIYAVLSHLPSLILSFPHEPETIPLRIDFEKKFESDIISPNLISVRNTIQNFKNQILKLKEHLSLFDLIDELISPNFSSFPNLPLYRLTRPPSFSSLKNVFSLLINKQDYTILELYLNSISSYKKLENFNPIIQFTNYALEKFNHEISRKEARETAIRHFFSDDKKLNLLYDKFLIAWRNSSFDELQYECHRLPVIEFDYDSPLIYFLVDINNEYGGGMYMSSALIQYSNIQNNLLSNILSLLSDIMKIDQDILFGKRQCPVQVLKKSNILTPIYIEDIITTCYLNNWETGKGKEITYDFDSIQKVIIKDLLSKKLIDTENLSLIQYSFELLNTTSSESGIILKIRTDIPQKEFDKKTYEKLEYFFRQLEMKQKGAFNITLKEIYNSLNDLLCYLKNSKQTPETTLVTFVSSIKSSRISKYLSDGNFISNLKLEYILSLFEYVEKSFFPYIRKYVSKDYKSKQFAEMVHMTVGELLNRMNDTMPTIIQFEEAVMRFISRYLIASLDYNQKVKDYISREDIWDISVSRDQILSFLEIFPDSFNLSHSIVIYKSIKSFNNSIFER
jgi:hypothetical protein